MESDPRVLTLQNLVLPDQDVDMSGWRGSGWTSGGKSSCCATDFG